jgi:hypothetical protein
MKTYDGHIYQTSKDWYPVVIRNKGTLMDDVILRPAWLSEYCPGAWDDYDAYCHPDDSVMDGNHRSVYFFRDKKTAIVFALRWS